MEDKFSEYERKLTKLQQEYDELLMVLQQVTLAFQNRTGGGIVSHAQSTT